MNGIPLSHLGCHLNTFDFRGDKELKKLTCRFLAGERFWLYLHGRTGVGKTHFAVGVHRAIVSALGYEGADSSVISVWPDMTNEVKKSFDGKNYVELIDVYMASDTLIIDDLTTNVRDFQSSLLEEIVRRRHAENRRLVITSNESYDSFLGLFGEHEVSRIRSTTVAVTFDGPDGRLA
jgi:DNA replication protein DnaC